MLSVCLERLDSAGVGTFTRCVALPASVVGLGLSESGDVAWQTVEGLACELWASSNGELIVTCGGRAGLASVTRAGRALSLSAGQSVVVLPEDEVALAGGARWRVHLHGLAHTVAAPEILAVEVPADGAPRAANRLWPSLAAAVVGAVGLFGATGCPPSGAAIAAAPPVPVPVRERPPAPPPNPPRPGDVWAPTIPPSDAGSTDVGPIPAPPNEK